MTRFVGICQYDGTLFSGFQFQKNARSVQDELEKALKSFSNLSSRVNCAGRTDKGVHALSQIFDFSVEDPSRNINWIAAFNSSLPDDLVVTHVECVRFGSGLHLLTPFNTNETNLNYQ